MEETLNTHENGNNANTVLAAGFYYLDLSDNNYWLIKDRNGKRFTAGYDKNKVVKLIERLNNEHLPNVHQGDMHEIYVCWNNHEKGEKCDYEREI